MFSAVIATDLSAKECDVKQNKMKMRYTINLNHQHQAQNGKLRLGRLFRNHKVTDLIPRWAWRVTLFFTLSKSVRLSTLQ